MKRSAAACLRRGLDPALSTVLANWCARIVSAGTQVVAIPLLVRSLGAEAYGVYVVILSLYAWYLLADLGLGYTLQNRISVQRAGARPHADDVLSTAAGLAALLLPLLFVAAAAAPLVTHALWGPEQQRLAGGGVLVAVAGTAYVLTAFGNLAWRVLYAEQAGWLANVIQGLASLLTLGLVIALTRVDLTTSTRLLALVLAYAGPQALLALAMLARAIVRARVAGGRVRGEVFFAALKASRGFLAFGLLSLLTLQVDYLVLASCVAPAEVVKYNVIAKVLGITLVFFQAALQAYWPRCAEAGAAGDWAAIRAQVSRLLRLGALLVMGGGLLYAALEGAIMAIVSPLAPAGLGLPVVALFTAYLLIRVWSDTYAMVLQSMSRMRVFMFYVPVQAALSLGAQVMGARLWGVAGVVGGLAVSFLLTSCWILPVILRRIERA